jgi:hypothetical protein
MVFRGHGQALLGFLTLARRYRRRHVHLPLLVLRMLLAGLGGACHCLSQLCQHAPAGGQHSGGVICVWWQQALGDCRQGRRRMAAL